MGARYAPLVRYQLSMISDDRHTDKIWLRLYTKGGFGRICFSFLFPEHFAETAGADFVLLKVRSSAIATDEKMHGVWASVHATG